MKNRFLVIIFLVALGSLVFLNTIFYQANFAQAAALEDIQSNINQTADNVGITDTRAPEVLVGQIINTLLGFLGVIFLLLTIYAGFKWMTTNNPEEIKKVRAKLVNAVIGLAIILAAYLLVNFVIFTLLKI